MSMTVDTRAANLLKHARRKVTNKYPDVTRITMYIDTDQDCRVAAIQFGPEEVDVTNPDHQDVWYDIAQIVESEMFRLDEEFDETVTRTNRAFISAIEEDHSFFEHTTERVDY